ncbi:MAG TPA: VOC family protein, partial [Bryobacteraceae bacterium]|nr:VOC family protein [Bryobacteraceae bacterium]
TVANQAGVEGSIMQAAFTVGGEEILCSDSTVTPAISLLVECESEQEIGRLCSALSEQGKTFMPLGNYGFRRQVAWVSDRFGVAWQLNLE